MEQIPMTQAGYNKLRAEVDQFESVDLVRLAERVAAARAEGDLRENAEYHGARESMGMLQAKINMLKDKLSRARIIDTSQVPKDQVGFGCTVRVKDLDLDEEESFTLVGAGEEDIDNGKLNIGSPLAQGLVGKKTGEVANVKVPAGILRFKILDISFD